MHILIFLEVGLFALSCATQRKGRIIRKVMVGGQRTKKKIHARENLVKKKYHARRVDQKKIPALAFDTFAQISRRQAGKHTVCKTSAL